MKPWRLFILICGLPSLICAIVLIFLIPESPKFAFSQGDEAKTLRILQRIHHMNTGLPQNEFNVKGIIKDSEFGDGAKKKGNFFKLMWSQSVLLFKGSYLRNILTACFIQFTACYASNGFWTFLPEILNKVSLWNEGLKGPATVCTIFHSNEFSVHNQTEEIAACKVFEKLEVQMFIHVYEMVVAYAITCLAMTLLINRVGKLVLLLIVSIVCGLASFLLIFLEITYILSYIYISLLLSGLMISVVNASTIELFPTRMRAMAICISMMVGRIGSASGSLIIGFIIDNYCDLTFLMPAILLITSAVLACTIPNITKRNK